MNRMKCSLLGMTFLLALNALTARASIIWSTGPGDVVFTMAPNADPTLPANQDAITGAVALTRGASKGLFNAVTETFFDDTVDPAVSPADTAWAFSDMFNPTFTYGSGAAAHASLTFNFFEDSLGGQHSLLSSILSHPGVLHLISEDIYLDIQFSAWQSGGGGGFSYTRAAAPVPEPGTLGLLALAVGMLGRRRD